MCLIQHTLANEILTTICKLAESMRIETYDEDSGRGTLRHAYIRIEASSGLTQEEIERMKRDAEANAEADKKAQALVKLQIPAGKATPAGICNFTNACTFLAIL